LSAWPVPPPLIQFESKLIFKLASIDIMSMQNHAQSLGELCLTTVMSGTDQQFIHYVHDTYASISNFINSGMQAGLEQ